MDPDIGVFTFESTGILKRTDSLTIAAAQAPIRFNEDDFHGELYLPEMCCRRKRGPKKANIEYRTAKFRRMESLHSIFFFK